MAPLSSLFRRDKTEDAVPALLDQLAQDFDSAACKLVSIANRSVGDGSVKDLKLTAKLIYRRALVSNDSMINLLAELCLHMTNNINPAICDTSITRMIGSGGTVFRQGMMLICRERMDENNPPSRELVVFFGELFKLGLVDFSEVHRFVHRLLSLARGYSTRLDAVEGLCVLYESAGNILDTTAAYDQLMGQYFDVLTENMHDPHLSLSFRRRILAVTVLHYPAPSNRANNTTRASGSRGGSATPVTMGVSDSHRLPEVSSKIVSHAMKAFFERGDVPQAAGYFRLLPADWHVKLVQMFVKELFESKDEERMFRFASEVLSRCAGAGTVSADSFKKGFARCMPTLDIHAEHEDRGYDWMASLIKAARLPIEDIEELAGMIQPHPVAPLDKLLRALAEVDNIPSSPPSTVA